MLKMSLGKTGLLSWWYWVGSCECCHIYCTWFTMSLHALKSMSGLKGLLSSQQFEKAGWSLDGILIWSDKSFAFSWMRGPFSWIPLCLHWKTNLARAVSSSGLWATLRRLHVSFSELIPRYCSVFLRISEIVVWPGGLRRLKVFLENFVLLTKLLLLIICHVSSVQFF